MKKLLVTSIFCSLIYCCSIPAFGAKAKESTMPPTIVESTIVKYVTKQQQISATGTLNSIPGIVVKPEISGRVTNIYFKSGDTVAKGAPLIEIYPDIIKAQLSQAQASLQLAKLNFDRASKLLKTHDISAADFDKSQADFRSAQAQVSQSEAALRQTTILAPFAGRLGLSQVNLGDYVSAGNSIVNLQSLDPIYVDFSIPESYMSKVAVGQKVTLHTDAYPNIAFQGKIEALESAINQSNRTLMLRASAANKDGKLLPGTFAEVVVSLSDGQQVIEVPQTAIVFAPEGNFIYKIVDGKAKKDLVTLGDRDADSVVIKSGVNVGDIIITSGQLKIQDGAPVMSTDLTNKSQVATK